MLCLDIRTCRIIEPAIFVRTRITFLVVTSPIYALWSYAFLHPYAALTHLLSLLPEGTVLMPPCLVPAPIPFPAPLRVAVAPSPMQLPASPTPYTIFRRRALAINLSIATVLHPSPVHNSIYPPGRRYQ